MFEKFSLAALKTQVGAMLEENPNLHAVLIAEQLGVTEGEIILALPDELVTHIAGEHAQAILEALPEWGMMTTIVHSMGSIFEVKAPFPKGKEARGYYNLMGKAGEMHGHLKLDRVSDVVLVSKPVQGNESYFIGFLADNGECIFKIYLGRDEKRQLIPEQVEKFNALKQAFVGEKK
ncbi:heme utilization cystosolic carrier protein HutX [Photobacterium halotolerans]|uniref:Heme utilization cystosolic carrier protein HutX n=1 Tax=Photobacterium halotolerans TaxID=265726 RepID=A0A7X4WB52_9GAMM|nr:heme utilization cystosolic carrier protein HutX [Photobacterium halotolerans]NAW84985.1 heme utilization cystosolic carrier protein HutX [Photobacterium halotolerans]